MTLSWAWTENTLAMTLSLITDKFGEIKGHSEAPVSLKQKVKCLRSALRSIDALDPLQQRGSMLAERLVALGSRRNDLVHGAMWKTREGEFQTIGFRVIAGKYATAEHGVNVGDAVALEREISELSNEMTAFMLAVDKLAAST